jgi:hypothetical protein
MHRLGEVFDSLIIPPALQRILAGIYGKRGSINRGEGLHLGLGCDIIGKIRRRTGPGKDQESREKREGKIREKSLHSRHSTGEIINFYLRGVRGGMQRDQASLWPQDPQNFFPGMTGFPQAGQTG